MNVLLLSQSPLVCDSFLVFVPHDLNSLEEYWPASVECPPSEYTSGVRHPSHGTP